MVRPDIERLLTAILPYKPSKHWSIAAYKKDPGKWPYQPGDGRQAIYFWQRWPVFCWAFDACWSD